MAENRENIELLDKDGGKISEPTLWERLFFIERFYKKNRRKLIIAGVVVAVGGLAYLTDHLIADYREEVVNKAYYNYQRGIEPEANLQIVEELNPKLYSLIALSKAIEGNSVVELEEFAKSSDAVISDMAEYQLYSLNRDAIQLNGYSYKEGSIYRDLAIVSEAYKLIEDGEMEEAQNRLSFIEDSSSIKDVANYLNHFGTVSKSYDASQNQFIRDDININGTVAQ
jgi:predicted negative regulator of RcsB-dependent stress response